MTRRARAGKQGFTLIELTVSLVAGLIVALGIVGLSREATHTFHEEMRSSAAEANLRTGDRPPARRPGARRVHEHRQHPHRPDDREGAGRSPPSAAGFAGLARLASISSDQGGSAADALPLSAQQATSAQPGRPRHRAAT